jgi:hypothetical protein
MPRPDVRAPATSTTLASESDERSAVEYCERLRYAFDEASLAGEARHHLQVGDTCVRLEFAGDGLAPVLLPALSPLLAGAGRRPHLEVELWDETSTGVDIPPPPWRLRDVTVRGDVRGLARGPIRVQVDTEHRMLALWHVGERRGIVWAAEVDPMPYWVRAAPLRSILSWGLSAEGRHLVHAAAVGDDRAGALIIGPAGSGKSTTAAACLLAGLGFVGDDTVLAETAPVPRAVGLYASAKVSVSGLSLLKIDQSEGEADGAKFVLDVARLRPTGFRRSAAISVIILPRVTSGRLTLRRMTQMDALRALAPSTILQHPGDGAVGMAVSSALVQRIPAYVLELGSDIEAVAPAICELLDGAR